MRDGQPIRLERQKSLALLAHLALTRRPHSREWLAALLWPEIDSSRVQLRNALSGLRLALGDDVLATDRETISLRPGALTCDVLDLLKQMDAVMAAPHKATLDELAKMADTYGSGFMPGFNLRDAPDFDAWQRSEDEHIRRTCVRALHRLASLWSESNDYERAIVAARHLARLDPLHEEARRMLMRLYMWTQQRSLALHEYRQFRQVLAEQIGVEPDAETRRLAEAIQSDQQIARPPATRPLSSSGIPVMPDLYGRDDAITEIIRLITGSSARIVTITGAGGIGKTHLAATVARQCATEFPDGAWFVSLDSETSPDLLISTLMNAFHLYTSLRQSATQTVIEFLRPLRVLLVLDNAHWLRDPHQVLAELLAAAPGLRILCTAYDPLGLSLEHRYALFGLTDAPAHGAAHDALPPAVHLFVQSARRASPGFTLTPDNSAAVLQICAAVQGFPLAIILAAAWCDVLTPQEINAEINTNYDFLISTHADIPERHRSMRTVFETTWNRLSAREQHALQSLSAFEGGFSRLAAESVAGVSLETLKSLVVKTLVNYNAGARRYSLHDIYRQYAYERMTPDEARALRLTHAEYFTGFLITHARRIKTPNQHLVWREIDSDLSNLRAAWGFMCQTRQYALLTRMIEPMRIYMQGRGFWDQGVLLFDELRAASAGDTTPVGQLMYARSLARMYRFTADSLHMLLHALAIAESHDDEEECANIHAELAWYYVMHEEDLSLARAYFERALEYYAQHNDGYSQALMLRGMAYVSIGMRQHDQAFSYMNHSLQLRRQIGDQVGEHESLTLRGELALLHGNLTDARLDLQIAHDYFAANFSDHLAAQRSLSLGWAYALDCDWEALKTYLDEGPTVDPADRMSIMRCNAEALRLFMQALTGSTASLPADIQALQEYIEGMPAVSSTVNPDLRFLWLLSCFVGWLALAQDEKARAVLGKLRQAGMASHPIYVQWLLPGLLLLGQRRADDALVANARAALSSSFVNGHAWVQNWGLAQTPNQSPPAAHFDPMAGQISRLINS
jgi:predicted ATPase/DNA-binding SARP family transcriptional activator